MIGLDDSIGRVLGLTLAIFAVPACGADVEERPAPKVAVTAAATSRADANKALVRRYFDEVWAKKNLDAVPTFFASDLVNHAAIPEAQGADGMRSIAAKVQAAFPDITMHVDEVAAEGDEVIARVSFEGTHTGTLAFKKPLAPTGKHVNVNQVNTFRIKDGRIVECWMVMDHLEMLQQLGALPGS